VDVFREWNVAIEAMAANFSKIKQNKALVSADGLEPSTHALKGHCSAN
jgi:hypothetical protein